MMKFIIKLILKLSGWSVDENVPAEAKRCVMLAAPHTSNWDFYYTRMGLYILGVPVKIAIKNFWTQFPFGLLIKPLGGLGIDRSKKTKDSNRASQTDQMAAFFKEYEEIAMVIAPEGTRSYRDQWKTGFYHIAQKANVPIAFGYLDYKKKIAGVGGVLYPSGDIAADMQKIIDFYKTVAPRYPELFSGEKRYDKAYVAANSVAENSNKNNQKS